MKYKVAIHRDDARVSVSVPALPGCWSEGNNEAEALENIRDAISEYLAAIEDRMKEEETREVEMASRPVSAEMNSADKCGRNMVRAILPLS